VGQPGKPRRAGDVLGEGDEPFACIAKIQIGKNKKNQITDKLTMTDQIVG
jgi:hypothetical protein